MRRRSYLKTLSLTALAPSLCCQTYAASPSLPIIDTHQHLWDLELFPLSWIKAPLDKDFLMKDYLIAIEGQHVIKSIYMEVGVPPELKKKEALWALDACKNPGNPMVGAVISADPTRADFEAEIRSLAKDPCLKGIRYTFRNKEEIRMPGVLNNIRLLGELGLCMDLNFSPGNLHLGNLLLDECPGTQFIINHCGGADPIVFLPKGREAAREGRHHRDQWSSDLKQLAQHMNVICKISGIVDNAGTFPLKPADLAPIIDFCLDNFGPDRIIFGGDWLVCLRNMSLARWINTLKEVVAHRPSSDQRKLFHDNAAAFYQV